MSVKIRLALFFFVVAFRCDGILAIPNKSAL